MTIAPKILPGHVNQRLNRVSRLLFHWRASDFSLTPVTGETPTFVRATGGGLVLDSRGYLRNVAQAQPRWDMSGYNAATGLWETPGLRLEGQRTNSIVNSQAMAAWGKNNAGGGHATHPTITDDALRLGALSLSLLVSDDAAEEAYLSGPFAQGVGAHAFSFVVKGVSTGCNVKLTEETVGVVRWQAQIDFSAAGVPTVTPSDGTYLGMLARASGGYRILGLITSLNDAVHLLTPSIRPGTGAGGGSIYVGGWQLELGSFPSSEIKTGAAAVTRNADALTHAVLASKLGSQLTGYVRFARPAWAGLVGAHPATGYGSFLAIGDPGGLPLLWILIDEGAASLRLRSAIVPAAGPQSLSIENYPSGNPATVEVCAQFDALETAAPRTALDVGAGLSAWNTAGSATQATWPLYGSLLFLGARDATTQSYVSMLAAKLAPGLKTMAQMREAF